LFSQVVKTFCIEQRVHEGFKPLFALDRSLDFAFLEALLLRCALHLLSFCFPGVRGPAGPRRSLCVGTL